MYGLCDTESYFMFERRANEQEFICVCADFWAKCWKIRTNREILPLILFIQINFVRCLCSQPRHVD